MVGCETAGRREVQLSDSFTRTPPAMEHTAVPRISIEFASPSKEKVGRTEAFFDFSFPIAGVRLIIKEHNSAIMT